jgi:ubiquinone biosynthesis O-methyltransferase
LNISAPSPSEKTGPSDWWAAGQENVYAHRKRLQFIVEAVETCRAEQGQSRGGLSILDVGCGTGIMITLPLASIGYRVTGIDIDGESIEAARRVNPYPNAAFRRGDAGTLAAAGERYDVVIASEVLEHLTDPLAFLRTLRGLLTHDGILVLTTPNGYGWFEWEQYLWDQVELGDRILRWHERWGRFTQRLKAPIKRLIGWQPAPPPPPPPWEYLASTQTTASPHVQRFRWSRVKRIVTAAGLTIARAGNSSPVCGKISHFYLRNRRAFIALNAWIGDFLPRWAAAGWYLVCHPATSGKRVLCVADSGLMAQAAAQIEGRFGAPPTLLISFRQLRQQPGLALRLPWRRFDIAAAVLTDIESPLYRDFILAYLFVLRAKRKALCDIKGGQLPVEAREGFGALLHCLADLIGLPLIYGYARWKARRLSRPRRTPLPRRPLQRQVAYLRANLWQESRAGGSVAHTGGVLAGLAALGMKVTYVGTTQFPPAQRLGLDVCVVPPQQLGWLRNLPDLSFLVYSEIFGRRSRAFLAVHAPDFVYQRYSVLNCSGADVADRLPCPLVLEYNGSEVWVARHWSTPMMFEGLADRIECANLRRADLVVVVSQPLRDEIVARGISPERVLINPNAVDPTQYHPAIDGGPVRARLGLEGKLVIGFIGTFGPWHGAEVLAQTVRPVAARLPQAHFLFVGDGSGMPRVREIIARDGVGDRVTLAGLVPQEEGPAYLAACDILASPHVPNPDGSRFFGSPTKLFEYMAMGKGIVASDLEQIGEILSHQKTAWLVTPGDPGELAVAILALAQDAGLRSALGEAARAEAVERHTWKAHVERILRKMVELELLDPSVLIPTRSGEG